MLLLKYKSQLPNINVSHTMLEGYVTGKLVVMAATRTLEQNGFPLRRANFMDTIFRTTRSFDILGVSLGPYGDGVGSRDVAQSLRSGVPRGCTKCT
jgi:hypothetical protein